MTAIVDMLRDVTPAVPICPTKTVKDNIVESARIFCEKTKIWTEQLEPMSLVANQREYDLTVVNKLNTVDPIGDVGDIVTIEHVEIDQQSLDPISERYLDATERGWRRHRQRTPRRFYGTPLFYLGLVFTPNANRTDVMDVWVSLKPLRGATEIEDFLYRDWKRGIAYGAIALLKEIPRMPWTDVESALYYWNRQQEEIDIALEKKLAGYADYQGQMFITPDYTIY